MTNHNNNSSQLRNADGNSHYIPNMNHYNPSNVSSNFKHNEKISDKNLEICYLKEENLKLKIRCEEHNSNINILNSEIEQLKLNQNN